MKILITGGAGFIGYYLTKVLKEQGDEVAIYDGFLNFTDPSRSAYDMYLKERLKYLNANAKVIRGDVRNKSQLMAAFNEVKPDVVVHLAALAIAPVSNKQPEDAISINVEGTANMIDCARICGTVKRIVYASSSFVYGDFVRPEAQETDPTSPVDMYGATKLCGELLLKAYQRQFGLNYTIIRPSAVYGPMDVNNRVTQMFVENAVRGIPLTLHDGGEARLDFTYIDDIVQGFALAVKSPKADNQTFNVTRGESRSLNELAKILQGMAPNLKIEHKQSTMTRPKRGTLDISKAKEVLGYKPKYSLEDGMRIYFDFVKKMQG